MISPVYVVLFLSLSYCQDPNGIPTGKIDESTNFEVRALLVKCSNKENCRKTETNQENSIPECPKCDRLMHYNSNRSNRKLAECINKLLLTIKVKNHGLPNERNQYIIIDHAFDPQSGAKQKLLYPYVVKIRQKVPLQVYDLTYETAVNAQAKEKVLNKENDSYVGCNTDPVNPTCGLVRYKNQVIPYSTGFCCSCKQQQSEFAKGRAGNRMSGKDALDRVASQRTHKRGGQNCTDFYTPPEANPQSYHESTHCLEFSDLWYSVYNIGNPRIEHNIELQIFEKTRKPDGSNNWLPITKTPIVLSSSKKEYCAEGRTILGTYSQTDSELGSFDLNGAKQHLMIPELSKNVDASRYPELQGGPEEYLVVDKDKVQSDGNTCDVAGVGYKAFVTQPNRCSSQQGTCLHNQPREMWEKDHEAELSGHAGCYFLKYHGKLPPDPVQPCKINNDDGKAKILQMYYSGKFCSVIDMEIKADYNVLTKPDASAIVTDVYTDSMSTKRIIIIARIFNSGLIASNFIVKLTNCPKQLPGSFSSIVSQPAQIPPQHYHVFNLEVHCDVALTHFFCMLQVVNKKDELVAMRAVRFRKKDRCVCVWYCSCGCLIKDGGLKCQPLSLEQFHAAGFQGSLPVAIHIVEYTFLDDMISFMIYIFLFVSVSLVVMGLIKAIVGCFYVPIGLWGLDILLGLPKPMNKYYEKKLAGRTVVYDEDGWPIDPETKKKVHNIALPAEFCMNLVFFFVYPIAFCFAMVRRHCVKGQQVQDGTSEFDICECKSVQISRMHDTSLQTSTNKKKSRIFKDEDM